VPSSISQAVRCYLAQSFKSGASESSSYVIKLTPARLHNQ